MLLAARAEALARAGAASAAQADYAAALRLEPNNARLWGDLGQLHRGAGRWDEAERAFTDAIRFDSAGIDWLLARGDVRFSLGKWDPAFADYSDASRRRPDSGPARLGLGRVYLARADHELAARTLDRAIELDGSLADAYFQRARCHDHFRSFEPALSDASHALELNPNMIDARRLRAELCVRLGRSEEAYDDLAQLIRQVPNDALVYFLRGKLEASRERFDSAVRDLTMSLKLDPRNSDARAERGLAYRRLHKNWYSLVDFVQAVQADPKHSAEYMVQRGIVAGARKQYNRAIADFAVALQLNPNHQTAARGRGMVTELRAIAEAKTSGGEPASREVLSAANDILGTLDLGIRRKQRASKKRSGKLGTARVAATKIASSRRIAVEPVESVESNVAKQMLQPVGNDYPVEEQASEVAKASPAPPAKPTPERTPQLPAGAAKAHGPLTGAMSAFKPGTGVHKAAPGTGFPPGFKIKGTGTFKTVGQKESKKGGFFGGLFGSADQKKVGANVVVAAKPSKMDAEALKKARRDKIKHHVKIAIIPIGLIAVCFSLYSQLSGPDIEGAVRDGHAAGYPVSASMTAEDLHGQFVRDSAGSAKKYDEQYIEVSGKVRKVMNTKTSIGFVLATSHEKLGVECRLLQREDLDGIKEGDQITVHGSGASRPKPDHNVVVGICKVRPK